MKAFLVLCTFAVLFNLAPPGAQAGDLGPSASRPPMQATLRDSALPAVSADPGTIAYVQFSTHDIHVISPDGTGDRVIWAVPQPFSSYVPLHLAWRPDGRELAFASDHEEACSWYWSDVYAIGFYGGGYRRLTNAPACAALASLPKGAVKVIVRNYAGDSAWVYVQGAPAIKPVPASYEGTVTFDGVADLGPGVLQPTIGIGGLYRYPGVPPYADVQPGQTVNGGSVIRTTAGGGKRGYGAGQVSWKADGSTFAYAMGTNTAIRQLPAHPSYGSIGVDLPVAEKASPYVVAWGPTPATKDQYLYVSEWNLLTSDVAGIYLNTVGDTSGGAQLLFVPDYSGQHIEDVEWLPDGSGLLFSLRWVPLDICSDIFEYNFTTKQITQLTPSLRDKYDYGGARDLSISPDGQQIVFERAVYPSETSNSVWIINRDGSGLHKLADDAGRPAWGPTPSFPAPAITSLSPSNIIAGSSALTLRVNGAGFVSDSVVRWNGWNRTTTYVNDTQLTAIIPAADVAAVGTASVTVFNPAPGGGASNTAVFVAVNRRDVFLPAIRCRSDVTAPGPDDEADRPWIDHARYA